jgi:hypothetical protein
MTLNRDQWRNVVKRSMMFYVPKRETISLLRRTLFVLWDKTFVYSALNECVMRQTCLSFPKFTSFI